MGEVWDKEKQIDPNQSESYRSEIYDFISQYHSTTLSFMMTMRKNGQSIMRPVSTFIENWQIFTISQHHQLKVNHVKNNPNVGYMFIDNGGPAYMSLGYTKNVWVAISFYIVVKNFLLLNIKMKLYLPKVQQKL